MLNFWMRGSALLFLLGSGGIFWFLLDATWPFIHQEGLATLWGTEWYPYEGLYGLLPAIIGTAWSVTLAVALALPTGVAAAVACDQIFSSRWSGFVRFGIELLAGIPSVIYGLIGLWLLAPWLQSTFRLLTGHTLLAAGLLLSVMILPTIMLLSLDAIAAVDDEQHDAAKSLGMEWGERLFSLLLPQAWPGIRAGLSLALGRALGETMAVMLMVGSIDRIPSPWYNVLQPAQTLTSRIGREIGEASFGTIHFSALMSCGLLLAAATLFLSLLAHLPFSLKNR